MRSWDLSTAFITSTIYGWFSDWLLEGSLVTIIRILIIEIFDNCSKCSPVDIPFCSIISRKENCLPVAVRYTQKLGLTLQRHAYNFVQLHGGVQYNTIKWNCFFRTKKGSSSSHLPTGGIHWGYDECFKSSSDWCKNNIKILQYQSRGSNYYKMTLSLWIYCTYAKVYDISTGGVKFNKKIKRGWQIQMLMRIYVVGIIWASLGTVTSSFSAELHCRIDFFFLQCWLHKKIVSRSTIW